MPSRAPHLRRLPPQPPLRRRAAVAFTLMEVLIAIAITGLLFVGMNTFVFSMGEIWGRNSDKRLFDQHVRAVTRFLERELRNAALPPALAKDQEAFVPADVRPSGGIAEQLLTFDLPAGSRLIPWPERPLPEVACALQARERQGLFLLWHSRLEERFDDDPPREVLVSPFGTSLSYDYYDFDTRRWQTDNRLRRDTSNTPLTPQRIRIKFTHGTLARESVITLPATREGLPNF